MVDAAQVAVFGRAALSVHGFRHRRSRPPPGHAEQDGRFGQRNGTVRPFLTGPSYRAIGELPEKRAYDVRLCHPSPVTISPDISRDVLESAAADPASPAWRLIWEESCH